MARDLVLPFSPHGAPSRANNQFASHRGALRRRRCTSAPLHLQSGAWSAALQARTRSFAARGVSGPEPAEREDNADHGRAQIGGGRGLEPVVAHDGRQERRQKAIARETRRCLRPHVRVSISAEI